MILKSGKLQKKLERQGWDVDADISVFQQSYPIGKFIPDIRARKRENLGKMNNKVEALRY